MRRAFVDTSAWYAYARADDPDHARVSRALEAWEGRLVTSNFVFDEIATLAQARLGHAAAVRVGEALRGEEGVRMARVLPEDEGEAWAFFRGHRDKGYSFTDCSSFAVMRRLKIPTAISTDAHFRRAGFEVEPRGQRRG